MHPGDENRVSLLSAGMLRTRICHVHQLSLAKRGS
jgi:hypothetical protein